MKRRMHKSKTLVQYTESIWQWWSASKASISAVSYHYAPKSRNCVKLRSWLKVDLNVKRLLVLFKLYSCKIKLFTQNKDKGKMSLRQHSTRILSINVIPGRASSYTIKIGIHAFQHSFLSHSWHSKNIYKLSLVNMSHCLSSPWPGSWYLSGRMNVSHCLSSPWSEPW